MPDCIARDAFSAPRQSKLNFMPMENASSDPMSLSVFLHSRGCARAQGWAMLEDGLRSRLSFNVIVAIRHPWLSSLLS